MAAVVFIVFGAFLILGAPIVTSMGLSTFIPTFLGAPGATSVGAMIRSIFGGADSTPIIAVPLFILAGMIMARGGISRRLFNVFAYLVGKLPAGMICATIITCLFYGAISGSGPATAAAVGTMTIPLLVEMGYDKVFCASMVATAGSLGVIIPPSIPFVLYGLATGASVGNLFIAGVIPGILIGLFLMVYSVIYVKRHGENREKLEQKYQELHQQSFGKLFLDSFWALLSPVIILGGIYGGYFTPTEAACVSVFYSLIVSIFIYKDMKLSQIGEVIISAVHGYAPICFILALATGFARALALMKVPQQLASFLGDTFSASWQVLLAVVVIMFLLGMVMDTGPAIVIIAPMLAETLKAFNISDIHFGVIMVCTLAIGLVTPPFGLNLFVTAPMIDTPVMQVGKRAVPLIIYYLVAILLITFIPALSLMLL